MLQCYPASWFLKKVYGNMKTRISKAVYSVSRLFPHKSMRTTVYRVSRLFPHKSMRNTEKMDYQRMDKPDRAV